MITHPPPRFGADRTVGAAAGARTARMGVRRTKCRPTARAGVTDGGPRRAGRAPGGAKAGEVAAIGGSKGLGMTMGWAMPSTGDEGGGCKEHARLSHDAAASRVQRRCSWDAPWGLHCHCLALTGTSHNALQGLMCPKCTLWDAFLQISQNYSAVPYLWAMSASEIANQIAYFYESSGSPRLGGGGSIQGTCLRPLHVDLFQRPLLSSYGRKPFPQETN